MSDETPFAVALETERKRLRFALAALTLPGFATGQEARPFVMALEGPNGAGKTTLGRGLGRALGVPVCPGTDAPWVTEPLKTRMIREADWFASAMFFLSGCCERMRLLRSAVGPMVLLDRSLWSTLAVHAATHTHRLESLLAMLQAVAGEIRIPHLTLVLEASFATCQARIARKAGRSRALDELTGNAAFHTREQEFYRWLGRQLPSVLFLNVDDTSAPAVLERASALLRERLPC